MINIGVQISSVRKYLQTPEDILTSFKKVSQIGYKTIQLQWISPNISAEFINAAIKEAHLTCIGTQDYYDEVIPHLENIIKMNVLYGSNYICVSGIPERFQSYEGCLAFAKELNMIAERLEYVGKLLILHPRWQEFMKYDGKFALDILLENTTNNFQLELDVYHIIKAGYDPIFWIKKVKGRMDLIHFKDMTVTPNGEELLMPVGHGNTSWSTIFDACSQSGVKYGFAEQETWQKDPFQYLKESYDFITTHGIK